jgi:4'-phosphopantetheinyl transferase
VRLDPPIETILFPSVLSPDELGRARRFHFEEDRMRFVRCRSALRIVLSRYLAIPASEIVFEYQTYGKPGLVAQQNPQHLSFNVSHSAGMALIAISAGQRLGVDIEQVRADFDLMTIAERFFSPREQAGLLALPDQVRVPAFFACWTRKESFIKAIGDGLSFPLAQFSVNTEPDVGPMIEEIHADIGARKHWSLTSLNVGDDYCATLTVEGALSRLENYTHIETCAKRLAPHT